MVARPPLVVPLLALAGFLGLLALTVAGWAPLDRFDTAVSDTFRGYGDARPRLVEVLRIATDVAATMPFLVAGLAVTVGLAARGGRRAATFCAAVTVLIPVLWGLMHWLVFHPRPENGFVVITSNGFPSGHTSNAAAAALVAVLLLWSRLGGPARALTVALTVAFAAFVGLTRVALLAHWPTDVLGGWLLALAVVPLTARLVRSPTGSPRLPAHHPDRAVR
ncbi:phosphatase PAP2 family protein [Plantactinospora mayteni]|uniref:Phosphoesterase, PA-phosphatase related protein n=1 Tax=Plantactinospora mayteni TaxID=566021 RepID=A0ABQ4EMB2_9ACTN|nr:phosphatase PAP2 family protein [Plantactinospora mayteni]GIG95702.1 putative phosphoesterase, PA-phosphatase related protein [Plantactinospora mayteni]